MKPSLKDIHYESEIAADVFIDSFTTIGKGVIIEKNVYIGKGVSIYGKALIKSGSYIGEGCIIGHPQRDALNEIIPKRESIGEFEGPSVVIGENCTIRAHSIIYSEVSLGDNCQTGHNVMIREKTSIGENTLIGTDCIIDGTTTIGHDVSIQTGVYIPLFSSIGNHVFLGPYAKLTNDKYMLRKKYVLVGPHIDDYVVVGANAVILPSIRLKTKSIIGAGAVVTKNTEENEIVVGNPAKFLKNVPETWQQTLDEED